MNEEGEPSNFLYNPAEVGHFKFLDRIARLMSRKLDRPYIEKEIERLKKDVDEMPILVSGVGDSYTQLTYNIFLESLRRKVEILFREREKEKKKNDGNAKKNEASEFQMWLKEKWIEKDPRAPVVEPNGNLKDASILELVENIDFDLENEVVGIPINLRIVFPELPETLSMEELAGMFVEYIIPHLSSAEKSRLFPKKVSESDFVTYCNASGCHCTGNCRIITGAYRVGTVVANTDDRFFAIFCGTHSSYDFHEHYRKTVVSATDSIARSVLRAEEISEKHKLFLLMLLYYKIAYQFRDLELDREKFFSGFAAHASSIFLFA